MGRACPLGANNVLASLREAKMYPSRSAALGLLVDLADLTVECPEVIE